MIYLPKRSWASANETILMTQPQKRNTMKGTWLVIYTGHLATQLTKWKVKWKPFEQLAESVLELHASTPTCHWRIGQSWQPTVQPVNTWHSVSKYNTQTTALFPYVSSCDNSRAQWIWTATRGEGQRQTDRQTDRHSVRHIMSETVTWQADVILSSC